MTITEVLTDTTPHISRARAIYRRLTDEQRGEVVQRFERHLRACRRVGIEFDRCFLPEVIEDVKRGLGEV